MLRRDPEELKSSNCFNCMKSAYTLINSITFVVIVCVCSASVRASDTNELNLNMEAHELTNKTIIQCINHIGHEHKLKFLVYDQEVLYNGELVDEMSTITLTSNVPKGSIEQQLNYIQSQVPAVRWKECNGIIWLMNRKLLFNSPLDTSVACYTNTTLASNVAGNLYKIDSRFIPGYTPNINDYGRRISGI